MTTGTNHFVSKAAADKYYSAYGFNSADVSRKLADNEIKIGRPNTSKKVSLNIKEGRYFIED
jgi:hypothetical protein